jgi:retinol dehydrogenase-12
LAKLLAPIQQITAKAGPVGSVRIVWLASSAIKMGDVDFDDINGLKSNKYNLYGQSKIGNVYLSQAYSKRYAHDNIISVVRLLFKYHEGRS